jgi:hypothetical protein
VVRMEGEGGNETIMVHLNNENEVVVRMEGEARIRPLWYTLIMRIS